ncbi:MAG: hypothetical protein ACJAYU_003657 [Bradymonadia bacterium]|jgi:hypothetical protein
MADNFFSTSNEPASPDDGLDSARLLKDIGGALATAGHLATFEHAAGGEIDQERALATMHFYAYCNGVFSARQAAALCGTDAGFQLLLSNRHVTHQSLLEYRDGANKRLALLFTELIVALTDCGLDTFGHTPLHAVVSATGRVERARAAAELAVTLLNAAKRRDDIENARYGFKRRGDELPSEILQPEERLHRINAMLRMRGADAIGTWDEPTKLIDLNTLEDGFELGASPLPDSLGQQLTTAANEAARDGLLPRSMSASLPAVQERSEWNPHIDMGARGGTIPDEDVARIQAASDGRPLPPRLEPALAKPTAVAGMPPSRQSAPVQMPVQAITPATAQVPAQPSHLAPSPSFPGNPVALAQATAHEAAEASGSAITHPAPTGRASVASSAEPAAVEAAPAQVPTEANSSNAGELQKQASSAVMGKWLMGHWQKVIVLLLVLVVGALLLTLKKF